MGDMVWGTVFNAPHRETRKVQFDLAMRSVLKCELVLTQLGRPFAEVAKALMERSELRPVRGVFGRPARVQVTELGERALLRIVEVSELFLEFAQEHLLFICE